MLGTSPETPLGPGIRDIDCVCEEIAHGRNTVLLLLIPRLFLASRGTQR